MQSRPSKSGCERVPELWRDVPGFAGYQASDRGRIRSVDRTVKITRNGKQYERTYPGAIRKPRTDRYGYEIVNVSVRGNPRTMKVHRMVLMAFAGEAPEADSECCHADANRKNNRRENLRWGTSAENGADMVAHGRHRNQWTGT